MPRLPSGPLLVLDSGSPLVSVAIGRPGRPQAARESFSSRSSTTLMQLVDDGLRDAALTPGDLGGVLVLSGPGSFTGLRVGMSMALGFHQSLGLAAGTLSTFDALAQRAPEADRPVHAVVRALRTDWYVQRFERRGEALGESVRLADDELLEVPDSQLVGFGLEALVERQSEPPASTWTTPGALATTGLDLADRAVWDPFSLTRPAYLAPPPARRRSTESTAG